MRLRRGIFMLCSLLFSLEFTFAIEIMRQCPPMGKESLLPNFQKGHTTSDSEYSTNPSETAGINSSNKRLRTSDHDEVPAGINSSPPPSAALSSFTSSPSDNITDQDFRDSVIGRGRRLLKRNTTRGPLQHLRSILCNRLSQLTVTDPTFEVGLEISDSSYLFKLLEGHDDSNLEFENITQKAARGAALLQQGEKLVKEVQGQLKSAMKNLTCSTFTFNTS